VRGSNSFSRVGSLDSLGQVEEWTVETWVKDQNLSLRAEGGVNLSLRDIS